MKIDKNAELKKVLSVLRKNRKITVKILAQKLNIKQLQLIAKINLKRAQLDSKDYTLLQATKSITNQAIRMKDTAKAVNKKQRALRKSRHNMMHLKIPENESCLAIEDSAIQRQSEKFNIAMQA